MEIQAALIKEQGVTFAVVSVKQRLISAKSQANEAIIGFSNCFPGMPIILMAQDSRGTPSYYGRRDIVQFLRNVHPGQLPWKKYRA